MYEVIPGLNVITKNKKAISLEQLIQEANMYADVCKDIKKVQEMLDILKSLQK